MDPTEALAELRTLTRTSDLEAARRMRQLIRDLDRHLTNGGNLPAPWRHGHSAAEHGGE